MSHNSSEKSFRDDQWQKDADDGAIPVWQPYIYDRK